VPLGASPPGDPLFALRPETVSFANFLSIKRLSVDAPVPAAYVAVQTFLGNPLLFYSHQSLFRHGIGAFDSVSDEVNRIDPSVKWHGLGDIVRRLYFLRLRSDASYDVQAFSPSIELTNPLNREAVFHVDRHEGADVRIRAVTIEGTETLYHLYQGQVLFDVTLGPWQSRKVEIEYENEVQLMGVDVSKRSIAVTLLRKISDFRDMVLSRTSLGQSAEHVYYQYRIDALETRIERRFVYILVSFAVMATLAGYAARHQRRGRRRRDTSLGEQRLVSIVQRR
jgi:hypothetical protein